MNPEIQDALDRLLAALRDLRDLTDRRFTLDGFALGDLGETVASLWYRGRTARDAEPQGPRWHRARWSFRRG